MARQQPAYLKHLTGRFGPSSLFQFFLSFEKIDLPLESDFHWLHYLFICTLDDILHGRETGLGEDKVGWLDWIYKVINDVMITSLLTFVNALASFLILSNTVLFFKVFCV